MVNWFKYSQIKEAIAREGRKEIFVSFDLTKTFILKLSHLCVELWCFVIIITADTLVTK